MSQKSPKLTIESAEDSEAHKRTSIRADFNQPMKGGRITDYQPIVGENSITSLINYVKKHQMSDPLLFKVKPQKKNLFKLCIKA